MSARRHAIIEGLWGGVAVVALVTLIAFGLIAARCAPGGALQVAETPINRPIRQGAALPAQAQVAEIYDAAARDINALMGRALLRLADDPASRAGAFERQRAAQLLQQLQRRVAQANIQGLQVIDPAMRSSVQLGLAQASSQMRAIGFASPTPDSVLSASFTNIDAQVTQTIARDTAARLAAATNTHAINAQALFRTLSTDTVLGGAGERETNLAIARGLLTGDPRVAERALRQRFADGRGSDIAESYRKLGNRQITVGGWTGSVRTYTETVMRTRTREATVQSRHEQLAVAGIDLVQIIGRRSENFCTDYLGLVCALTPGGASGAGYPSLASLPNGGPPFHPNCSKGTIAFVLDLASPERQRIAETALNAFRRQAA
jgi:hypothetical protein